MIYSDRSRLNSSMKNSLSRNISEERREKRTKDTALSLGGRVKQVNQRLSSRRGGGRCTGPESGSLTRVWPVDPRRAPSLPISAWNENDNRRRNKRAGAALSSPEACYETWKYVFRVFNGRRSRPCLRPLSHLWRRALIRAISRAGRGGGAGRTRASGRTWFT